MKLDSTSYQNLKQTTSSVSCNHPSKLKRLWNEFGNLLVKLLKLHHDPVIHEFTDRNGNRKWRVYDSITDKKVILDSSKDVLIWLEKRYSNH